MKILATGMEWFEHIPGGLNQYYADYLKAMAAYGHEVEGLLTGEGQALPPAPAYIRDVMHGDAKLTTLNRIRSFYRAGKERAAAFRPQVFNPHFALYASLLSRSAIPSHIPIVTHFHGPWAHESMVEDMGGAKLPNLLRFAVKKSIEQNVYRRSDAFIVLSVYFRDVLSREFGIDESRIHVIPGAADIHRFRPAEDREGVRRRLGLAPNARVLFSARRLVRRMGIDQLIRAMRQVCAAVPDTVLLVAGAGPLEEELKALIAEQSLQGSVRMLGRVSNEELVDWYQAADLSIVPTLTLEGFGLVTTEALACGTPVLGTPYGGTKEILEGLSEQLLFADHSPEAMAQKLVSVLTGECPIPSREACRDYVLQHYTWPRIAACVTEVLEQAIQLRKEHAGYEGSVL
ncbi:glycosyltransferase family 4 protein [Paenibacillus sp. GD4]|uniref:glycosyltransferase family 4 protein n=1 Tax=Paenibacillus sp. GD4 TaxID=3068890 RepID=UPI002796BE4E|nr:glycosyltransferase family 4 protein [Paenibacillus sp. GD4]MDQ1910391.1 glycosyltransferase family 4 protein [Paenibacillus sp. GD4]